MASFVGTTLAADRITGQSTKFDFARVLVDVKESAILPDEIPVRGPNGVFMQQVIYEWKI